MEFLQGPGDILRVSCFLYALSSFTTVKRQLHISINIKHSLRRSTGTKTYHFYMSANFVRLLTCKNPCKTLAKFVDFVGLVKHNRRDSALESASSCR